MILDKIDQLLKEVQTLSAKNADEVEQLRLKYLSKKGEITALMNDFRSVAADEKKTIGMKINELKTLATERINQLREECQTQEGGDEAIDLTRTPYPMQLGTRHPLTIVTNEIIDIFSRMGFVLADGPEVEDDLHVFTKMNFAADHPARDMQDTFFVSQHPNDVTKNILLRSHTSSVQARVMEKMPYRSHPRHLSRPCLSQRGYYRSCPLFLPSGGRPLYRQERVVHRLEAGAALVCQGDVRCRHKDSSAPQLLPLYRAQCRDGHILLHLRWRGLRLLQAYWLG